MEASVEDVRLASEDEAEIPEAVQAAITGGKGIDDRVDLDATEWLLESDGPTDEEVEPVELILNVGTPSQPRFISWYVVPLPGIEFKRFQKMAMGNRQTRRQIGQGDVTLIDDAKFHLLVVAAATVKPNLAEVAQKKGTGDPATVLAHRFRAKPGIIAQISGKVSDISGNDPDDVQVVTAAGNS